MRTETCYKLQCDLKEYDGIIFNYLFINYNLFGNLIHIIKGRVSTLSTHVRPQGYMQAWNYNL